MNSFIEERFNSKADYFLVQMEDISNFSDTYPGSVFLVGFNLPREFWDRKLKDITIGEYEKLERMTLDSNISLSDLDYPPFQLGQTISSVARCRPLEVPIWELVDEVRSGKVKNNWDSISEWVYEWEKAEEKRKELLNSKEASTKGGEKTDE